MNRAVNAVCRVDHPENPPHDVRMPDSLRNQLFHPPRFWRINFLVWLTFGFLAFTIRYIMHQDMERAIGLTLTAESLGFVLSGVLRHIYKGMEPYGGGLRTGFFLRAVLLTLATALIQAGLVQAVVFALDWHNLRWTPWDRWILLASSMWFVYLAWTLGYFWVKAEIQSHEKSLQAAEARAEAQRMELQLLRFQLDPHFLFNSLNGILSEIPQHPPAAMEMLSELSSYLRYSLDHRHEMFSRLAVELDATSAYLKIQKIRFGTNLRTRIEATAPARNVLVPCFLLQPLVENAFKHGFASVQPPWELSLSASLKNDCMLIQVRNSGRFFPSSSQEAGLGLDTIRRRLQIHYPERHRFEIGVEENSVVATMELGGVPCSV